MIKKLIVACSDDEVRKIVVGNASSYFGEKQVLVCKSFSDLYDMTRYAKETAVVFDKYFLGYVLSYALMQLKILNDAILSYFVEIGECSRYLAMRTYELGCAGFIPEIESKDISKINFPKIQNGMKVYPDSIMHSIKEEDYLLDRKCITEVTTDEMALGMYLSMGKTIKEICYITGYSSQWVNTHVHRLKRKIGYKQPADYYLLSKQSLHQKTGGEFDN